jgi:oxygen-dependent protoporphyrinogen oxidase
LQILPDALEAQLGDSILLNAQVIKLLQIKDDWRVTTSAGGAEHSAVIYCGTAHKLVELKIESQTALKFSTFSEVRYVPVASVVLGFCREDMAHSCEGFGMLIPKIEGFKILGTIFSWSLFPNRAPVSQNYAVELRGWRALSRTGVAAAG